MARVIRKLGWALLFFAAMFVAGTVMSAGNFKVSALIAAIIVCAGFVLLTFAEFLLVTLPTHVREQKKRVDRCPRCKYTLPVTGTQLCPECGVSSSESERRPTQSAMSAFRTWQAKGFFVCGCGFLAAVTLTAAEYATTWCFGFRAYGIADSLTYQPTWPNPNFHLCDGWVIPTYQFAHVWGGYLYDEGEQPGIRPEVFRPTRWTPWVHVGYLFYTQDPQGNGRVFYYID